MVLCHTYHRVILIQHLAGQAPLLVASSVYAQPSQCLDYFRIDRIWLGKDTSGPDLPPLDVIIRKIFLKAQLG